MTDRLRERRLRAQRIAAPAATPVDAARHQLAVQAQEFWGGRWALAVRSRRHPTLRDVDAAFDAGLLVRSWPMRGTLHIVPAEDLAWMLGVTAPRQLRAAASRHRELGIDQSAVAAAERVAVSLLGGGGRATRAELWQGLESAGIATAGQRGVHLLQALSLHGVVCHGPVVPRADGPTSSARSRSPISRRPWPRRRPSSTAPEARGVAGAAAGREERAPPHPSATLRA